MIFNVQHTANWEYIRAHKQRLIHKDNKKGNKSYIPHTYQIDDKVMLHKGTEYTNEAPSSGPCTILQVNTNGTVRLHVGSVTDTINIRCIEPYKEVTAAIHGGGAICDFLRENEELQPEQELPRQSDSKIGAT
jgi:hypothetical protein